MTRSKLNEWLVSALINSHTTYTRDLRKLTAKDLNRLLLGFGVSEEECAKLKRWDKVDLVRMHSTKAEQSGVSAALHKYVEAVAKFDLQKPCMCRTYSNCLFCHAMSELLFDIFLLIP